MSYSQAKHLLTTLERAGHGLSPGARILDFGCGSGGLVYEFRELGFDAYGFDQHERVDYRSDADRRFFGFSLNGRNDASDQTMAASYQIPFASDFFDAVVSTSVIEHVLDLAFVNAEIFRVLKPSGVSIHTYPSRLMLIEPHTYVPLGGLISAWPWLFFWALLGIRTSNQETLRLGPVGVANNNALYYRTGLRYLSHRQLLKTIGGPFLEVRDVSKDHWRGHVIYPFWQRARAAMKERYPLRSFSPTQVVSVVLAAGKPRHSVSHRRTG